ncbi:MAG TPA: hypothetical protein VKR06_26760 [Ktedonosporobacter sp.]|nr:hypothetical protein [Ktedonosporobacter sp.]
MTHSVAWSPYVGSNPYVLAGFLLLFACILTFCGFRLRHPRAVKGPGAFLGALLVGCWFLAVIAFLLSITAYALAQQQQAIHFRLTNPITPVTFTSAVIAFLVIQFLARQSGFRIAISSAIVGTIAAPMIFELPFDLLVMWHTYPPAPPVLYTLLYFVPLFLVEILSFALLSFSPVMKLTRSSLFLLAGMFLLFALWAVFGFAYPSTPIPIALNMLSKVAAFATAVSLFTTAPVSGERAKAGSSRPDNPQ